MNKVQPQPAGSPSLLEAPSDLELMQYFDGELEEPRRTAVAAFVGADARARNKLSGLRMTSSILQGQARSLTAADNIADLVMAKISAQAAPAPAYMAPAHVAPAMPAHMAPAHMAPAMPAHMAPAHMYPAPAAGPLPAAPIPVHHAPLASPRPAANDNARRIFGVIAALAVAAAAGLAVWSRMGTAPTVPQNAPIAAYTSQSPIPSPKATEPEVDAAIVAPEVDTEPGVEVAAVNFGAHTGSIFIVPSGSIEAKRTTTVVWLADDAGE